MLPDYALSDITPNDILTLRLRRDSLIDALLNRIEELQDAVMEATDALDEAEGEAKRLQSRLDQATYEIRVRDEQTAVLSAAE